MTPTLEQKVLAATVVADTLRRFRLRVEKLGPTVDEDGISRPHRMDLGVTGYKECTKKCTVNHDYWDARQYDTDRFVDSLSDMEDEWRAAAVLLAEADDD
jgi:hypothetical protein